MDVESIDSGEFERIILSQIAARAHFVLVLAPGSLERTVDRKDWLRREIEHAIKLKRNIVPVLVNDFSFADQKDFLRGELARLTRYNGLTVPNDYFEEAMQRLRERFLKQPVYGSIAATSPSDQHAVAEKIEATARQPAPTAKQLSAEQYHNRAFALQKQGKNDAAIDALNQAIALRPDFSEAYSLRGYCYKQQKNHLQAVADYTRSIELGNPMPDIPYHGRGIARAKLENWEGALKDFDAALKANPRNVSALVWRATAYDRVGNFDAAIVDFEAYLAFGDNIPPGQATPAQVREWIAILREKQQHKAESKPKRWFKLW